MPEIQGLRALAVGLVVLFHLWPLRLPGGYVGVDVFFVISGFLITSHLLRELDRSGSIRLGSFYARRARRLLPASLLVLGASAIASVLVLPPQLGRAALREVTASTFYVENLWLTSKAVTYSASNDTASPVQHYWSLSTEEQFYALWPALILVAVWVGTRVVKRPRRSLAASPARASALVALSLVAFASLTHSIVLTATDPAAAYFVTTTRAWEFAAGALTSFLVARWVPRGRLAAGLRWSGFVAIVATAFTISQATPFPGAVALAPVLGTVAIILAGETFSQDPLLRVSDLRPIQWLGDVSYAVYLWHWPLIALGPFVVGRDLTWIDKSVILLITGALAHLTRKFVEQPFISGFDRFVGTPLRTLTATLVAMAVIAGSSLGAGAWMDHTERIRLEERIAALASDPCLGAGAALDPGKCGDPFAPPLRGPVSEADSPWAMPHCDPECWNGQRPAKVMAVVGDSHAQTLYHALAPMAELDGYGLAFFLKGGCPFNLEGSDRWQGNQRPAAVCGDWSREALDGIRALQPDVVVTMSYVGSTWSDSTKAEAGFARTWDELGPSVPVVVLRDYPTTGGRWSPECLAQNPHNEGACAVLQPTATPPDAAFESAKKLGQGHVDLSDIFCDAERCYPVVGSLPVYWDSDHITGTFARSLAPVLATHLDLP